MGHYINNGGLCQVTITDVPPEVEGAATPSSEHPRSVVSCFMKFHFFHSELQ